MPAPIQWDTVSVPFVDGISPATRDRLLPATKLLALENGFVFNGRQVQKRLGHVSTRVRTQAFNLPQSVTPPTGTPYRPAFSFSDPGVSANWLFGFGQYQDQLTTISSTYTTVSAQSDAGVLHGQFTRDNETVTWDGFRSFSYTTGHLLGESYSPPNRGLAIMPQMRVEPMAKVATAQLFPDAADNGTIRVVAWCNSDGVSYSYSVFDSATGSCLVDAKSETLQSSKGLRVLTVGQFAHILIADRTAGTLELRSIHQDSPSTAATANFPTTITNFDVKKVDETQFLIAAVNGTSVNMFLRAADGTSKNAYTIAAGGTVITCACAAKTYGAPTGVLMYMTATNILGTQFDLYTGATQGSGINISTGLGAFQKFSVTNVFSGYSATRWDVFAHIFDISLRSRLVSYRADVQSGSFTQIGNRSNIGLHSHAFSVGTRSFAWAYTRYTLQSTYFLVDLEGKPVGKMCYGTANGLDPNATPANTIVMPGVSYTQNWGGALKDKDRYVWYGCLGYKQRVENTALTRGVPTGIYAEPSIKFYTLDFLAPLRTAQAGRATYIAGAQLWEYDGTEFNEAGFHMAPETINQSVTGTAGNPNGTYQYRVDLCYKNAQNEEVRSWSIIQPPITSASKKVQISLDIVGCTRREDAYFLVYRTISNQTSFYLCSSRDPTVTGDNGFVLNDQNQQLINFIDNLSDTNLLAREYHPANAGGNYLDPLPAPSCQVVAGGAGRLWLAGGELNPGELAPSRQFAVGESPSFHPAINLQVDRNIEPITAITFLGDVGVAFRRTSAYFIETDGPDNTLNPAVWQQPRLALTDVGAVGQEGVAVTTQGVWFQSLTGIRLLSPGGGMNPTVGQDVDPLAQGMNIAATVVVPDLQHIRFYSRDANKPSLVYNYTNDAWSTWTNTHCVGASYWTTGDRVFLSRADGYLWAETNGVYTDGGSPYEFRIRTSWQHAGSLGDFMRLRRWALFGLYQGPHTLRTRIYYNEEPFWHEEVTQQWPFTQTGTSTGAFALGAFGPGFSIATNTDTIVQSSWGDLTWGSGSWGDASNISGGSDLWFRNGVYRTRQRPKRQKCSVFSIEFSDCSAPNNSFSPVALGLELGRKTGLDRIPAPR